MAEAYFSGAASVQALHQNISCFVHLVLDRVLPELERIAFALLRLFTSIWPPLENLIPVRLSVMSLCPIAIGNVDRVRLPMNLKQSVVVRWVPETRSAQNFVLD
jgi:hypothetical protein